jgi:hypothetical protein
MLKPGQSIKATTRIDVGPLARYLANNPLEALDLRVMSLISPRETPQGIVSAVPMIESPVTEIRRRGLLGEWSGTGAVDPATYNRSIAAVQQQLTRGAPADRMRAARVVAALLGWIRQTENGDGAIPVRLQRVVSKPQLLGMMAQAEQSPMPVVRAEIATALNFADLGPSILNQLGPMIDDSSPLVRFRVAELIGASGTKGSEQMVKVFARDRDAMVRMMAQAFMYEATQLTPDAPAAPQGSAPANPDAPPAAPEATDREFPAPDELPPVPEIPGLPDPAGE